MTLIYPRRQKQLTDLVHRLGLDAQKPINWSLLDLALTHSSISADRNYEQLEFLGDAVVRLAASQWLMETYPDSSPGDYSAVRQVLVSDRILSEIAASYNLSHYLVIDEQAKAEIKHRSLRLADVLEAVLGALYLSTQSLELIRPWLDDHWPGITEEVLRDPARQNYKDALQEFTQARYRGSLPEYRVRGNPQPETGRFIAEVWFQGQIRGVGTGNTKKTAEQAAAKEAFLQMHGQPAQLDSN